MADGIGATTSGGRDALYSMWELPAAAYLLWGLAGKAEDILAVGSMVDAMRQPLENADTLTALHATALALKGVAAQRWLSVLRRTVGQYPVDYAPIFGATHLSPTNVDEQDEPPSFLAALESEENYAALTAKQRLLVLHMTAEIAASEADRSLHLLHQRDVNELRPSPLGRDSAGNLYWYFSDSTHLYREPSRKKTEAKKGTGAKKAEAAAARKAKQEERRIAAEKKKAEKEQRQRKREEERQRRRMEARAKWAPRHPNARVTRGSRAAEKAAVEAAMRATDSNGADASAGASEETPGRANGMAVDEPELMIVKEEVVKEEVGKAVDDETLRVCTEWECICASLRELEEFVERFNASGPPRGLHERTLLKTINKELIPLFQEREKRLERERRKAMMNEWRSVRKKSARVAAIEAEREAGRLAEREAKREAKLLLREQKENNYERTLTRDERRLAREAERDRIVTAQVQARKTRKIVEDEDDGDEKESVEAEDGSNEKDGEEESGDTNGVEKDGSDAEKDSNDDEEMKDADADESENED